MWRTNSARSENVAVVDDGQITTNLASELLQRFASRVVNATTAVVIAIITPE